MSADNPPISTITRLPDATFAEFLESHPPGQAVHITDLSEKRTRSNYSEYIMLLPELQLHCSHERCNGVRVFRATRSDGPAVTSDSYSNSFLEFKCSNCRQVTKTYSIMYRRDGGSPSGVCEKYGEDPTFGPPTPARLLRLIGPDREIFLKGRRCENQGLGIGASVYYRRVVENQKNRILEEVVRVSERIGADPKLTELLRSAIVEIQFKKAMEMAKGGIPETLLINGQNPLMLLHAALSEGVHELSDEECLDLATSIRVVLTELSERLAAALKDEAELTKALGKLMNRKKTG